MASVPRISIITAAYNAAGHIAAALDSVLAQTWSDWEMIVVDDGSTDATREVVGAYESRDPRIRFHGLDRNGGVATARNVALSLARGDWVTILDSDDRYEANRLEILLECTSRGGLDIVADNLRLCSGQTGAFVSKAFTLKGSSCALTRRLVVANDGPPRIASLGHLKPFFKRSLITDFNLAYRRGVRLGEDFDFLFQLLEATERASLIDYAGYCYTLPFDVVSGAATSGSRTPYGDDGLDDLRRGNEMLVQQVVRQSPDDQKLVVLLERRGQQIRDEGLWRAMRQNVRARKYLKAARLLLHIDSSFSYAQFAAHARRKRGRFDTLVLSQF